MFFEIEFMDGVKRIIDSRGVMQYRKSPSETRTVIDGWGCCMEYFITSLSQGKAIVITKNWREHCTEDESEVINTVNIRNIKPVDAKLDTKMFCEEKRKYKEIQNKRKEITERVEAEISNLV